MLQLIVSEQRSCDHRPRLESYISYSRLGTRRANVTYVLLVCKCELCMIVAALK